MNSFLTWLGNLFSFLGKKPAVVQPIKPAPIRPVVVPIDIVVPTLIPVPTVLPVTPTELLWDTPQHTWHSVRVLCDNSGLSAVKIDVDGVSYSMKDVLCACLYQESQFLNYEPDGTAVQFHNKDKDGIVWSTDWGLCQVNDWFHVGPGKDFVSVDYILKNPGEIVLWMIHKAQHGLLSQWSSFSTGAYKKWLPATSPMWKLAAPSV